METAPYRHRILRAWKPLKERLDHYGGFIPLTWSGLALSVSLLGAVRFLGLKKLDMVALAAGSGLLTCLALSIICVLLGALWLRFRLARVDNPTFLELVSGERVMSGFSLFLGWYIPMLRVTWTVEDLNAQVDHQSRWGQVDEYLTCRRRVFREGLVRRFQVIDTLGLSSLSWNVKFPGRVRVLPSPGSLEQPNILLSLVAGEDLSDPRGDLQGDRVDMRQYQKGDPMKFILWKVYSRSGKVMVRVPERALAARPRACCYLVSGAEDEPSAALARVLLELGLLGEEWRFGADGTPGHTNQLQEALDMVARSGNLERTEGKNLTEFLGQAEKDGFGFCLVLAPPREKTVIEMVDYSLGGSGLRHDIWVGVDVEEDEERPWYRKLGFLKPSPLTPESAFHAWDGRATVIIRGTGQVLRRSETARG